MYANNVALTSDKNLKTGIKYIDIDLQNIDESGFVLFDGNIIYRADDAYDSFFVTDLDGKNKVKLEG